MEKVDENRKRSRAVVCWGVVGISMVEVLNAGLKAFRSRYRN